jgi:diadenosine tetraphosphate (Ap4A) HIT family hydrolase
MPEARIHYVIIPKKDIKNIGELSDDDKVYLLDAFAVMQDIIKQEHLKTYIIKTNGPGYQDVAYLHFHLMAE